MVLPPFLGGKQKQWGARGENLDCIAVDKKKSILVIDLIMILVKILKFSGIIKFLSKVQNETKKQKKFLTFAENSTKCVKMDLFERPASMADNTFIYILYVH